LLKETPRRLLETEQRYIPEDRTLQTYIQQPRQNILISIKPMGSSTWKVWMTGDFLQDFTGIDQKAREESDHRKD
jgi:hypothetical protein